jgi:hypothetical protein
MATGYNTTIIKIQTDKVLTWHVAYMSYYHQQTKHSAYNTNLINNLWYNYYYEFNIYYKIFKRVVPLTSRDVTFS